MANTITGRIHDIKAIDTREHNGKTYFERVIILDATPHDPYTGEAKYPNFPSLSFSGEDKCNGLNDYAIGEVVTISFALKGINYKDKTTQEDKYFNKVEGYKIERYAQPQAVATAIPQPSQQSIPTPSQSTQQSAPIPQAEQVDDLPF